MRITTLIRCASVALVASAAVSCGDVTRSSRSPVILVVNSLQAAQGNKPAVFGTTLSSDVVTNVTTPAPCAPLTPCPVIFSDIGQVVLSIVMKDVTLASTPNNQVTITGYHIAYRRADGLNAPGTDVPWPFDGAVTATVPTSGTTSIGFVIVRNQAKEESPLMQLRISPNIISMITDVTFFGKDVVGNDLSVTGSMLISFGNFGDT